MQLGQNEEGVRQIFGLAGEGHCSPFVPRQWTRPSSQGQGWAQLASVIGSRWERCLLVRWMP
jgi:ABC-type uncharacterized transport system permease subunit